MRPREAEQKPGKQVDAAALFCVRQPDIFKMLRGDVEIIVKPHRSGRNPAALHVH